MVSQQMLPVRDVTELGGRSAVHGPVVREADELAPVLPAGSPPEDTTRILDAFARQVLPHLLLARPWAQPTAGPLPPRAEPLSGRPR